jgi:alpha-glucosidase
MRNGSSALLSSTLLAVLLPASLPALAARGEPGHVLRSPDKRIEVSVVVGDRIRYGVRFDGQALLRDSTLGLRIGDATLGQQPKLKSAKARSVSREIEPVVRQKAARLHEGFNELRLEFQGQYAVVFRAYDEGVAYRFETSLPGGELKVSSEEAGFRFAGDFAVYYPAEESFLSHNERHYVRQALKDVAAAPIASLPAVVEAGNGVKVVVADSDVEDYPGLWLRGNNDNSLWATFPPYPLEEKLLQDRNLKVVRTADYIALTQGTRRFPWRVLGIAERDADLITNPLVYLLAKPTELTDTSWIRPGKVAWDWWNANNLHGVPFKAGVNTETYKHYIDFASQHGLEYVILDEGWYKLGDLLSVVPEIDMDALAAHARQKNVGLILWVVWKTLADQLEPALDRFEKWGIKGIKVDFMQRDDQPLIGFYHRICREAAKRKMLVDFHGAQRSATMTRTWPNLISNEGVRGQEWVKWSDAPHPEHNVTLPFTRMFLGPMDYTPGAMVNAPKKSFAAIFERPMSLGTRAHQLAMYVVYESPLQMLADSPSNYRREPESLEFLRAVPVVWDETRVISAKVGEHILVARRSGRDWWLGAMTDWTGRELTLDLSFLPEAGGLLDAYQDGVNADRWGSDYKRVKMPVDRTTKLQIRLAEGGGWAARITPR